MARDRKAEAERRNAKARAEGFTSYGQKYRAAKQNYKAGEGAQYNAALEAVRAQRANVIVRRTNAGTVLSLVVRKPGDAQRMAAAIVRRMR